MPVSRVMETLVSGMIANQERHEAISNNLANVNSIGFKKDVHATTSFSAVLSDVQGKRQVQQSLTDNIYRTTVGRDTKAYTRAIKTSHTQGDMRITGNNFDLSLMGEGFFSIQTDHGIEYTRNGSFMLNSKNELITPQGNIVLGVGSQETEGIPIIIDGNNVTFLNDGTVNVDGVPVGQLRIVDFDDYTNLRKVGSSLFAYDGSEDGIMSAGSFFVEQGSLESSNVNSLSEMTAMLFNTRHFEMSGRSIKAVEQTINRAIAELGKLK